MNCVYFFILYMFALTTELFANELHERAQRRDECGPNFEEGVSSSFLPTPFQKKIIEQLMKRHGMARFEAEKIANVRTCR